MKKILIFVFVLFTTLLNADLNDGLVAYYPFNGNANDESGNGNHGTVNGATLTTDRFGNIDSCYEFDGGNDYIQVPHHILLQNFSVSCWFKPYENDGWDTVIEQYNSSYKNKFFIGIIENSLFVEYQDNDVYESITGNISHLIDSSTNLYTLWNNLILQSNNGNISIYLNNQLVKSFYKSTVNYYSTNIRIGADIDYSNLSDCYSGLIDDIRIYNRALSDQEILALYNENQQNPVSVLSGQVTDNEGNPIPQATISLAASNTNLEVFTNEQGYYTFSALTNNQVNLYVSKEGYQSESRTMSLESGFNSANFTLTEVSTGVITSLELSDDLTIYADSIEETIWDLYSLSGNVNINGILEIDGVVTVDKRDIYTRPLVHFTEGAYGIDIDGVDVEILPETPLMYTVEGPDLVPESLAYFCGCQWTIGGYSTEVGRLRFGNTAHYGDYVEVMMIIKPASKNFFERLLKDSNWVDSNDSPDLFIPKLEGATAKTYFSRNQGIEQACDISGLTCNFGAFSVEDFSLWLNPEDDLLGGSLEIRIPGFGDFANVRDENNISLDTKVVLIDNNANTSVETNLETLIRIQERGLFKYLQVGGMLEFVSGNLNSIAISVSGMDIPLFNTGTFIREINGGVYNLEVNDLTIEASVDIGLHSDLDIGSLGPIVYLNDFGTTIKPWNYFEGHGTGQIFKQDFSNARIYYDGKKKSLGMDGKLVFMTEMNNPETTVLEGNIYGTIKNDRFTAGVNAQVQIPNELPWGLRWFEGIKLASADLNIDNNELSGMVYYYGLSLAEKFEFGKESFPYFHYYIGTNYRHMLQLWKGSRDGRYTIDFTVPENCKQFLVVAGNELNLFDFTVTSPSGTVYDNNHEMYNQYSSSNQTVMVLDNPELGTWSFSTEQEGEIITDFRALNQSPSALVEMPANRLSRDNTIHLSLTDYNDTLSVEVFYDNDNQDFDGNFIQEFQSLNNSEISFNWSNSDVPNGEYFIYTKIDDGVNAPVMQYAPGSIYVDNISLEVPENISYSVVDDGLQVEWNEPIDNSIIVTQIDLFDIYKNQNYSYCVTDTSSYVIKDLPLGAEYNLTLRFGNVNYDLSDPSEAVNIIYVGNSRTSKPYFTMNGKNAWDAVVNQPLFKTLYANDFDSNNLTFHLNNAQTGMSINGYDFNWTPTLDQKGYYIQEIVVSDGAYQDTLQQQIFVYTEEQAEIRVDFSSFNLYEDDNMFVKISNLYCDEDTQTVSLLNNRTNQTTTVTCRRVNKFDYMGRFSLSVINRTSIEVQDGDAITANYVYDGQTYTNRSIYDSNPQPSDEIAPSSIADLAVESLAGNRVKLSWTSPGDDGNIGNAYKYDLRYSYTDIATSEDYLTANLITNVINPSAVGEIDSLIIDLTSLPNATDYDQLYFSIVSEDDNQNRSDISNCAYYNYLVSPASVVAEEILSDTVFVSWSDLVSLQRGRESTTFNSYNIYRLRNNFSTLIATNHTSNSYHDDISDLTDGSYQYAIEAVYNNGLSPKSYSNVLDIDRLVDVRILCQADSLAPANNVTYSILPLTTALEEEIIGTTNNSGMILIDNFHKADYSVNLSKEGCFDAEYTITINNQNNEFVLDIFSVLPPSFINIERENNNLIIEWNRVNGAKSYKIYGSSIPDPEDWGQAISVQSENSYQILDENLRFFRIISSSDDLELIRDKYNLSK